LLSLWDESGSSRTVPGPTTPASPGSGSSRTRHSAVGSGFSQIPRKTVIFVTHDLEEAIALADEVVVLSAGPATRVMARHPVTLARPRDLLELRTAQEFIDLYRAIWAVLRGEVIKSQRAMERSRG
jgi:energy-coupling factor transporter ATP-binding protein EcfA2